MANIRSRGNRTTELVVAKLFRAGHITGWRRHYPIIGRPDFAFPARRLAIFIDGCFWHGCRTCYHAPKRNRHYWAQKLARNRQRDRFVVKALGAAGWRVVRIWEHTLRTTAGRERLLSRVAAELGFTRDLHRHKCGPCSAEVIIRKH